MAHAQRIVSLISSTTEILYLLGLGHRVLAVSHECDYPAAVAEKPRVTHSLVDSAAPSRDIDQQVHELSQNHSALYTIDAEQLAAFARFDRHASPMRCMRGAVRRRRFGGSRCTALRNTQILALNPVSLPDVFDDILRVGEATGALPEARRSGRAVEGARRSRAVEDRNGPRSEFPRTACLEWIDPPMMAANWTPELIEIAGGESGLAIGGRHSTYAEWPRIMQYDPQIVVAMPCGFDLQRTITEAQVLARMPDWPRLSAVRDARVFAVDGNAYFNRSGPRLVDSLEILAQLFHPTLFGPSPLPLQQAWRRWKLAAIDLSLASPTLPVGRDLPRKSSALLENDDHDEFRRFWSLRTRLSD